MAKINEITGRLSGVIGPVVLVNSKNGQYIRSKGTNKKKKSEAQLRQCDKLRLASQFLRPLAKVLKRLYVEPMAKRNYQQAALSQAMRQAIDANGELVPSKVLISRGTLAQIEGLTMEMEDKQLVLSWTDNSQAAGANANDQLVVVIYRSIYPLVYDFFTDTTRIQGNCTLDLSHLQQGTYLVYVTFLDAKGEQVSNSCHAGSLELN